MILYNSNTWSSHSADSSGGFWTPRPCEARRPRQPCPAQRSHQRPRPLKTLSKIWHWMFCNREMSRKSTLWTYLNVEITVLILYLHSPLQPTLSPVFLVNTYSPQITRRYKPQPTIWRWKRLKRVQWGSKRTSWTCFSHSLGFINSVMPSFLTSDKRNANVLNIVVNLINQN